MITAIVVDDESPAREELIYILEKQKQVKVIGQASHGLEAISLNRKLKPDLMFLDIKMPKLNGIEVAKRLAKEPHVPYIVFITAYEEYALEAFEVNAVDYILKPVCEERLKKGLDRIFERIGNENKDYFMRLNKLIDDLNISESMNIISVYHNGKLIPLEHKDIIYATVEDKNTVIVSTKGKYSINCTLSELNKKLNSLHFFRSHKSYLINLDMIESIEPWFNSTYNVKLKNIDNKIPVSRSQSKEFKDIMNIS